MMINTSKVMAFVYNDLDISGFYTDPARWLLDQASTGEPAFLLVHADDGVIWGIVREGKLAVSSDIFPEVSPSFRTVTIQQAKLFGSLAEIRVWRQGDSFKACRIAENGKLSECIYDEKNLLWGTRFVEQCEGFTNIEEGSRGIIQTVPLAVPGDVFGDGVHPLYIKVRHYITYDIDGQAYIEQSRLLGIDYERGGNKR